MKFRALQVFCLCSVSAGWMACGAGHPTITRITVTPQSATSPLGPRSDTVFTASATFTNNTSRELTQSDGLSWSTSDNSIATIDSGGSATCQALGQVTVTAQAPADLNLTLNNGINNTSPNVTGTAQL